MICVRHVFGFLKFLTWKQGQKNRTAGNYGPSPDHPGLVAIDVVGQSPDIIEDLVTVHLYTQSLNLYHCQVRFMAQKQRQRKTK